MLPDCYFEMIHDDLLQLSGSVSLSSCPCIFTFFLELEFICGAWIHLYPNISAGTLILDLISAVKDGCQVGGHQVTHSRRSDRKPIGGHKPTV